MAGYILREDQPNIVLPAQQADRLIGRGDGDAALLYLCLLRADRGVTAQELQRRLKWSQLRLHAAETALQELGLIDRPPEQIYDRLGLEDQYMDLLGVKVPAITIPIKPGRNLAIILEIAAMNNRQKKMGYNAAAEFTEQINRHFDQNVGQSF